MFSRPGLATTGLQFLEFQVHGGSTANVALNAYVVNAGRVGAPLLVAPFCNGGAVPANGWTACRIPLSALGAGATLDGIELQEGAGRNLPVMYVDAIQLTGDAPTSTSSSSGGTPTGGNAAWMYRDGMEAPWVNGSWASHKLNNTTPVAAGTNSLSTSMAPWTAVAFAHPGFSTVGRSTLSLKIHGGANSAAVLLVRALVNGRWTDGTTLAQHCTGGMVASQAWTQCTVPLSAIAPAGSTVSSVALQEGRGTTLSTLFLDDLGVDVGGTTPGGTPPAVTVAVTPTTAAVSVGQSVTLAATVLGASNPAVTWSVVQGAAGGTVTAAGVYTAPGTAGTYQVVATSVAAPSKTATCNVTVTSSAGGSSSSGGAGTAVAGGTISTRTWTAAGSPYRIQGDISVPGGSTLTIQPGVTVQFQGHYRMTVTGAVDARGTASQPIVFTALDRTAGWYGMRIWNPNGPAGALTGHQYLEHCVFEYAVKQGNNDAWYNDSRGALFIDSNSGPNLHINNNTFRNNVSRGKGAALMLGSITGTWTMTGNVFQNNRATDMGGALNLKHSTGRLTLSGGSFTGNSTSFTTSQPNSVNGAGGAIVVFNDSNWTLDGVAFSGNTPDDWTGVVPTITNSGGAQPVTVTLSPATTSVTVNGTATFAATVTGTANSAVTFRVQEGNAGGTITSAGVYRAPASAGTFHVVATSQADPARTATATVNVGAVAQPSSTWVTGYYAVYQADMYPAAAVDFSAMTHLVVGAALPRTNGTLDTTFYVDAVNGPAIARDLTSRAHAAGRKAILMLGGAGAQAQWQGASSAANRATFVQNILNAMNSLGFDGVDLDWEPVSASDQPLLLALAQALKAASPGIIITVPVAWVTGGGADPAFAQLAPYVDQINIMSYQMADAWPGWSSWHSGALAGETSSAPSSISANANAYAAVGVPRSKIGIGIGFYGSCWRGVTGPRQATTSASIVANDNVMTFDNIMTNYHSAAAYRWDSAASVGSLSFATAHGPQGCNWVSYEDEASITAKGAWVKANGYGGTIIWTVNQGYRPSTGTNPPLDAVKRAFLQ